MSTSTALSIVGTSQQKEALYGRYARGELTLEEVTCRVASIRPAAQVVPRWRRIGGTIVTILAAVLLPQWAKRD